MHYISIWCTLYRKSVEWPRRGWARGLNELFNGTERAICVCLLYLLLARIQRHKHAFLDRRESGAHAISIHCNVPVHYRMVGTRLASAVRVFHFFVLCIPNQLNDCAPFRFYRQNFLTLSANKSTFWKCITASIAMIKYRILWAERLLHLL